MKKNEDGPRLAVAEGAEDGLERQEKSELYNNNNNNNNLCLSLGVGNNNNNNNKNNIMRKSACRS